MTDIIQFIYTLQPHLLKTLNFAIIEKFEHLREKQKNYIKTSFGDEVQVNFFQSLDDFQAEETLFIANEIFDAFPCELVYKNKIAVVNDFKIEFSKKDEKILETAQKYGKDKGEIAVGYRDFAERMKKSSSKFEFISFDYGDMETRYDFSIRIYKKHQVFPLFENGLDLKSLFGKSDITFDVDFRYLKDEFEKAGVDFVEYKTQMKALIDFGLIELLELLKKNANQKTYSAEMNRAKILIDPAFMGERFKMIRFSKK
jgi:SAM-dependent MidA family methyltransferase